MFLFFSRICFFVIFVLVELCLSVSPSVLPSVRPSVCPCVCVCVCLCVCVFPIVLVFVSGCVCESVCGVEGVSVLSWCVGVFCRAWLKCVCFVSVVSGCGLCVSFVCRSFATWKLKAHCSFGLFLKACHLEWWMSGLDKRWTRQRRVISIVSCMIQCSEVW